MPAQSHYEVWLSAIDRHLHGMMPDVTTEYLEEDIPWETWWDEGISSMAAARRAHASVS